MSVISKLEHFALPCSDFYVCVAMDRFLSWTNSVLRSRLHEVVRESFSQLASPEAEHPHMKFCPPNVGSCKATFPQNWSPGRWRFRSIHPGSATRPPCLPTSFIAPLGRTPHVWVIIPTSISFRSRESAGGETSVGRSYAALTGKKGSLRELQSAPHLT